MSTAPGSMTMHDYDLAAQQYLESLPLEHFMEAVPQSKQREITIESFAVLKLRRPDFQYFNELLVQYHHAGRLRQVVPDNMVAIGNETNPRLTNYAVELEPTRPFFVLEYVSPRNRRKDCVDNFQKYEHELKVPYYLLFEPDRLALNVYGHDGDRYVRLEPNTAGRVRIEELDLEIRLLDGWVRFWHAGELLPLPAELSEQVESQQQEIKAKQKEVKDLQRQIGRLELEKLRLRVQLRALQLGRSDVLAQLADANVTQLEVWLAEFRSISDV